MGVVVKFKKLPYSYFSAQLTKTHVSKAFENSELNLLRTVIKTLI